MSHNINNRIIQIYSKKTPQIMCTYGIIKCYDECDEKMHFNRDNDRFLKKVNPGTPISSRWKINKSIE